MSYVASKNISLKYQRFTPPICIDIGIWKFEYVAKTQFQSEIKNRVFKEFRSNVFEKTRVFYKNQNISYSESGHVSPINTTQCFWENSGFKFKP